MRTVRQRHGADAEELAVKWLIERGWRVVGRNVKVGRDEIDIVAIDPGPPPALVCVEVRSARSDAFGAPEEQIHRRKVGHLYRAMGALQAHAQMGRRVDALIVDRRSAAFQIRYLRGLEPP